MGVVHRVPGLNELAGCQPGFQSLALANTDHFVLYHVIILAAAAAAEG
jgi:hypothetical protein